MLRTCVSLGLAGLFTFVVAASAFAGDPEDLKTDSQKLTEILHQLKDVQLKMDNLQANQALQIKSMQGDIDRLRDQMKQLQQDVAKLGATTRVSANINPDNPTNLTAPVTGIIRLENRYNAPATVVVNGAAYRVMPAETRLVTAPVGPFTYEVFTDNFIGPVRPAVDRFLSPTREFPITIHP
jgi:TolA-binding protein